MRVPEISLGYGLLAQNKHDLCRYYKYTERHKQTQYLPAYTVSFMVVPSVRAWEFRVNKRGKCCKKNKFFQKKKHPDKWNASLTLYFSCITLYSN